ncbi:hypothetical protein L195_g009228, partial [Trifolium pratense]
VSKDCILPSEDANVRAEYTSTTHDEISQKCVENDKGENHTPNRKSTVMDKCSDITATLVDDMTTVTLDRKVSLQCCRNQYVFQKNKVVCVDGDLLLKFLN